MMIGNRKNIPDFPKSNKTLRHAFSQALLEKVNIKTIKIKIKNITDKAIFGELDSGLVGMLHYKEISYDENIENLKKFKKNETLNV